MARASLEVEKLSRQSFDLFKNKVASHRIGTNRA